MRAVVALLLLLLASCTAQDAGQPIAVHMNGRTLVLEGNRPLRALVVELAWDDGAVTDWAPGPGAARLNVIRVDLQPTGARVVFADSRKLRLPRRGDLMTFTGTGEIRLVSAEGADTGPVSVPVELR